MNNQEFGIWNNEDQKFISKGLSREEAYALIENYENGAEIVLRSGDNWHFTTRDGLVNSK